MWVENTLEDLEMMQKVHSAAEITDYQLFLFKEGTNYKAYEMLGSIYMEADEENHVPEGYRFAVWAPNAASVSLVGDFNGWSVGKNPLKKLDGTGVWHLFVPGMQEGTRYKYAITSKDGTTALKADPYAFYSEVRPHTASMTANLAKYEWKDIKWQKGRSTNPYEKPMLIYEVHAGSWKQHEDGSFLTYTELADTLVPYLVEMGYTHVELMPLTEYPYDGSWGYQVTGYFGATSRYGRPEELMYFIDKCHQNEIAVIMDWVPAHFPKDAHGLARFDGTRLYEYANPLIGEQPEWGTLVFNYKSKEVVSFLLSSAFFWFEIYHIDGLRVDAVTSMLYRNYGRKEGQWLRNERGGSENLEAIAFLQNLNKIVFSEFPYALMMAEESTAWPKVTSPVHEGGLGFNFKWNMGWMNDSLKYMSMDPLFRKFNHNLLTFVMMYAFSENYILPLSHDEVVHGKKSMLDKMFGSYEEKFSSLRAFYAYMMALPGKKLFFMGNEFGQFIEWKYTAGLDWLLLEYESHGKLHFFVKVLNRIYRLNKCLWQIENRWEGFEWINEKDNNHSVISFMRKGKRKGEYMLCVCNFTPVKRERYILGVPTAGEYYEILNTDTDSFGGSTEEGTKTYVAQRKQADGRKYAIELELPPLTAVYIRKKH